MIYRDSLGRFAPKPPLYPKADANGVYRHQNGKFASRPVNLFKAAKPDSNILTLTVADVINAIEKNGYLHTRGWEGYDSKGNVTSGCAIAQGAANLGVDGRNLRTALNRAVPGLGSGIISLNDHERLSIPQIVARVRTKYENKLNATLRVSKKPVKAAYKGY